MQWKFIHTVHLGVNYYCDNININVPIFNPNRHLAKLEFELPRDPDDQKLELLKITEEEHYRYIHPKEIERIQYYLTTVTILFLR